VKRLTGVKHRMSTAGETEEVTGYKPGGVCPFALPPEVEVYVDDSLADYETIYPAAGNDATGVPVTYSRLREITGAFECSVGNPASVSV
jgi:prolyl-tRNA editing enzyme YbaK/EbsC (Cys-tRNA(Pro) deacylase)